MRKLRNVVYRSPNLIVQRIQQGIGLCNIAVVVGDGHSVSVDDDNNITFCDPGYHPLNKLKGYGKDCSLFAVYFPKSCDGLAVAGEELAEFINTNLKFFKKIILHGHSKSGCCFHNLTQWLDGFIALRTYVVSVSSPFAGTPMVDYDYILEKADSIKVFSSFVKSIYLKLFSNHNVDRDICPNSNFLLNIDLQDPNVHRYFIVSKCGPSIHPIDWVLWIVDTVSELHGDGFVPLQSQIYRDFSYRQITASHATSMRRSTKFVRSLIEP